MGEGERYLRKKLVRVVEAMKKQRGGDWNWEENEMAGDMVVGMKGSRRKGSVSRRISVGSFCYKLAYGVND
jgi:hypothetical protein